MSINVTLLPPKRTSLSPDTTPGYWAEKALRFLLSPEVPSDIRDEQVAIILAALKNNRNHYPRYAYEAHIGTDGVIRADFARTRDPATWEKRKAVATVPRFNKLMRTLADGLRLTDGQRIIMFNTLKGWIASDARSIAHIRDEVPGWQAPEGFNPEGGLS